MTATMVFSAILYASLLIVVILELKKCWGRAEPIALLLMSIHGVIYFVFVILDYTNGKLENPIFWNLWSSTLRLHTILTITGIEFFRLLRIGRGISNGCK